ncbi:hypothetical protein MASR2M70_18090 [Bacillota bacterium]
MTLRGKMKCKCFTYGILETWVYYTIKCGKRNIAKKSVVETVILYYIILSRVEKMTASQIHYNITIDQKRKGLL